MAIAKTIGLLFAAILAASAVHAEPPTAVGIIGPDDRRILGDDDLRWNAIGRLNREAGGFCTAVLVAPAEVLTAAHCLWDSRRKRWFAPDTVHFVPGYRRGAYAGHAQGTAYRRAAGIEFTADGNPLVIEDDWAIVELDHDLQAQAGIDPLPLAGRHHRDGLDASSLLARAGYGRDRPHLPMIVEPCAMLGFSQEKRILLHDCDATFGASGSPILLKQADGYVVLGVQSAVITRDDVTVGAAVMLERAVPAKALR